MARQFVYFMQGLTKSYPTRKILDIALGCGIESSTVFYRAFRDAFGMNPTDYRRSLHAVAGSQWAVTAVDASAPQPA